MGDLVVELAALVRDYGKGWVIRADRETGRWMAVAYPSPPVTVMVVLTAADPAGLRVKLRDVTARRPELKSGRT
jgi:hypothetical protein